MTAISTSPPDTIEEIDERLEICRKRMTSQANLVPRDHLEAEVDALLERRYAIAARQTA